MSKYPSLKILSKKNIILSLIVFGLCLGTCLFSHSRYNQLGLMQGMAEEYVVVAYNLHNTGQMFYQAEDFSAPYIFRPPGYIFFLKQVFDWGNAPKITETATPTLAQIDQIIKPFFVWIYFWQAILFALSASLIFWWSVHLTTQRNALLLALSYGLNPYFVVLTGFLHYEILHIFFIVVATFLTSLSLQSKQMMRHFLTGILWGVASLIRPTTLILPVFYFLGTLLPKQFNVRQILIVNFLFILGMACIIAPYSARNYERTGRWIVVNAQAKAVIWQSTRHKSKLSPNHFNWWSSFYPEGHAIYKEATGEPQFTTSGMLRHTLALEKAYGHAALINFKENPQHYLGNSFKHVGSFLTHINTSTIKIFQSLQRNIDHQIKSWLTPGNPQNFHNNWASMAALVVGQIVTLFAIVGIVSILRRRAIGELAPLIILACFTTAVAVTVIDVFYYYVKMPILYMLAANGLAYSKDKQEGSITFYLANIGAPILCLGTLILAVLSCTT